MSSWNVGDVAEITGWLDKFEGVRFTAEHVRAHPESPGDWLIRVPDSTVREWKGGLKRAQLYFLEDENSVEFFSGFLKNHGPLKWEND